MLRGKAAAWISTVLLLGLMLLPLLRPLAADGYPLSTYPMFARGRESRVLGLDQALLAAPDGKIEVLPPEALGVHTELQAMSSIGTALGQRRGPALCAQIARRLVGRQGEVQLAHSTFDILTYFAGDPAPRARQVLARCKVPE